MFDAVNLTYNKNQPIVCIVAKRYIDPMRIVLELGLLAILIKIAL